METNVHGVLQHGHFNHMLADKYLNNDLDTEPHFMGGNMREGDKAV